ncbi:MAG: pentapeptide repeat-containing protein [Patescibacteria group bacterium]|nr:pentapeptide repeat-containing protein [Patescibacteria group bacterium]
MHSATNDIVRVMEHVTVEGKIDLSHTNFSYANLRAANLSDADLSHADLSYAKRWDKQKCKYVPVTDEWIRSRGGIR